MYMYEQVGGKKKRLVGDLVDLIRSGQLARGERLPGENQLAQQYSVSRGTVRSALSELQQQDLIATETGVGSFVTFDGVALDQSVGWARALSSSGSKVTTELLGIERAEDPALTSRFGVDAFISVRRLRRDESGRGVSLENALVPAIPALADLPERGLTDDSLTDTLREAGLYLAGGEQWITAEWLDETSAKLLDRRAGEFFLRATRISLDRSSALVEQVVSLLDPARFQFHLVFGRQP
ncbi:MAG: transcriptional regulator, GntR family [Amycolatopsis sp.]|uniref:GntR family transcriptional regulator n=1 Tax=Amycolatopsis sp. TaxID=37632 RepID=UPI0026038111|nr:GntR family transcriptional regulator [Amycolatopsis sp.]MCU1681304.1 transcriptional regulator, GntR family [Amycolatopsis sp.]